MHTLYEGDPDEGSVIVDTARQMLGSMLPGNSEK
jgi:pyruvate dehydrogenase (quinone)